MIRRSVCLLILGVLTQTTVMSQDPKRLEQEVQRFAKLSLPDGERRVVFTGSSSIRMWKSLAVDCVGKKVVNTGFGGSQTTDLLYYLKETVLRFEPDAVYIYEGDNDIAEGKSPKAILRTIRKVARSILESDPEVDIHFLSAKPSPSRWEFKEKYVAFNRLLQQYCESHPRLWYIDVWNPMLDERGRPAPHIFKSDSLHMNSKGYELWTALLCKRSAMH